ncbi:Hypothetical predicted protein [Pelobates cultripes]|uniref:Uncharacterized protein n=1 Tax=Pelobates cultripes TaxID=61616 RepID=A0AAD1S048_PELCU|nr:Hypothetical predicted protein [Pelobates cultripes]
MQSLTKTVLDSPSALPPIEGTGNDSRLDLIGIPHFGPHPISSPQVIDNWPLLIRPSMGLVVHKTRKRMNDCKRRTPDHYYPIRSQRPQRSTSRPARTSRGRGVALR